MKELILGTAPVTLPILLSILGEYLINIIGW